MNSNPEGSIREYCQRVIERAEREWQAIPVRRPQDDKVEPIPLGADMLVQEGRREPDPKDRRSFSSPQEAIAQALTEGAELVLVTGEPGAGKTASALWSSRFFARQVLDRMSDVPREILEPGIPPDVLLPVYLDLGEWKTIYAEQKTLAELLAKAEKKKRLPDPNPRRLWFLDGLDLVTGTGPRSIEGVVSDAYDLAHETGARFIFFSRPLGTMMPASDYGKLLLVLLNPLRSEERTKWVHDRYPEAESALAEFEAHHPEHRCFLDVPLLFAMALSACLHEKEKFACDVYPGHAGLFNGFLTYALRRAEEDRRITSEERIKFDTEGLHTLAGVFWAALCAGHEDRLPLQSIQQFLKNAFSDQAGERRESWDQAASILNRAGLLLYLKNESAWGVLHQQFAEFLAAFHLAYRLQDAAKGDWFELELWDHLKFMRLDPVTSQALAILSILEECNARDLLTRSYETIKRASFKHALTILITTGTEIGWNFLLEASRNNETRSLSIGILAETHNNRSIALLMEALKDQEPNVKWRAANALGEIKDSGSVSFLIETLTDTEPGIKVLASYALGIIKDSRAVVPLIEALKDPDMKLRCRAAQALGEIGDSASVAPLFDALTDSEGKVRWSVANALSKYRDPMILALFSKAIKDPDTDVRWRAVQALGEIRGPRALALLIEALEDKEHKVRWTAGNVLGRFKGLLGVDLFIDALKSPQPSVKSCMSDSLCKPNYPITIAPFVEALSNPEPNVRWRAAWTLGWIREPCAVAPLILALRDNNTKVRWRAAWALGELKDPAAVSPLIEALKDKEQNVRTRVVRALGEIKDPTAVASLIEALKDVAPNVRRRAARALGVIKDSKAVESLIMALRDKVWTVRVRAAWALGWIKNPDAVVPLINALNDKKPNVRRQAAKALGEFKDSSAVEPLIEILKDSDKNVRRSAAFALGRTNDIRSLEPLLTSMMNSLEDDYHSYIRPLANMVEAGFISIDKLSQKARGIGIDYNNIYQIASNSQFRLWPWSMEGELEGQHQRREKMRVNITKGGDTIINNFHGSIANINSNLNGTVQTINKGSLGGADKEELKKTVEALRLELEAALKKEEATPEQAKKAEKAAGLTKGLVEEAAKDTPNRSMLEVSAEGLKDAALALAGLAPTVLPLAEQLWQTVQRIIGG